MKIYILVGESSGDWYGGEIIAELKKQNSESKIRFWGGDHMLSMDANIAKHIAETRFMGFVEVVKNLPQVYANIKFCKADILDFKPDVILFIDYPGFNLRIAKWAKSQSIPTAWYIAPKVWAWKESRVKALKAYVDKLYVIFPFEVAYFAKHGIEATFLGSPLADRIEQYKQTHPKPSANTIALLPGSRNQELKRHLPLFFEFAQANPTLRFQLAVAQGYDEQHILALANRPLPSNINLVHNNTWGVLNSATFAVVASGTATLETLLFNVPQVVVYIANPISYLIAKQLVKIKYISLVNILAEQEAVPELIQFEATLPDLQFAYDTIMTNPSKMQGRYAPLIESLSKEQNPIEAFCKDLLTSFSS